MKRRIARLLMDISIRLDPPSQRPAPNGTAARALGVVGAGGTFSMEMRDGRPYFMEQP